MSAGLRRFRRRPPEHQLPTGHGGGIRTPPVLVGSPELGRKRVTAVIRSAPPSPWSHLPCPSEARGVGSRRMAADGKVRSPCEPSVTGPSLRSAAGEHDGDYGADAILIFA